jgi:hypothetical protein
MSDSNQIAVSTTPVKVSLADADGLPGSSFLIKNTGTTTVYLGGPAVTTSIGFPLDAGEVLGVDLKEPSSTAAVGHRDGALYAISATSGSIAVLGVGV